MRDDIIKKYYDLKAIDVDKASRSVKIAFSEMQTKDRDGDIILPTAFDKTFKERGPGGSNEIWHLLDHTKNSFSALSKFKELWNTNTHAGGVSHYKNSFAWREVAWPIYEAGEFTQHSIGFQIVQEEQTKEANLIKELSLWEGSAVLWGANPNTPTMEVVKGLMNNEDERDITAAEKIDEIIKRVKNGKYNEENQSLLIYELKRVQVYFDTKHISELFKESTEPEVKATLPDDSKEKEAKLIVNIKKVFEEYGKR
jgi:phage head maturation protease